MFGKKCTLCGGKVVQNICTECGLNQNKTDERYYKVNEKGCDHKPLTHSHKEETFETMEKNTPETQQGTPKWQSKWDKNPGNQPTYTSGESTKKKPGSILPKVIIFVIVVNMLFGVATELFDSGFFGANSSWVEELESYEPMVEEIDYSNVQYELEDTEISYDTVLDSGIYEVGVHIPEGTYTFSIEKSGTLEISDDANNIRAYFYFPEEQIGNEYHDIRLYEGAIIFLGTGLSIDIYTNNASSEVKNVEEEAEPIVINQDFTVEKSGQVEEGIYNLYIEDGYAAINIFLSVEDSLKENAWPFLSLYFHEQENGFENLPLLEGMYVVIDQEYTDINEIVLEKRSKEFTINSKEVYQKMGYTE